MLQAKPVRNPSPRQVLLGLFILFQLGFLIASNLIGFITWAPSEATAERRKLLDRVAPGFVDERGHAWHWLDQVDANLRRWTQLTGQDQQWSLFAPGVATATGFPAVLLLWDDPPSEGPSIPGTMFAYDAKNGFALCTDWNIPTPREPSLPLAEFVGLWAASNPVELLGLQAMNEVRHAAAKPRVAFLLSENEPVDIHDFIRVGKSRIRRYEGKLYLNMQPDDKETPDELAARFKRRTRRLVQEYHDVAVAYLRQRVKAWQRAHPDQAAPKQVILLHRLYRIRGPEEERGWEGPVLIPLLRWQPDAPRNANDYPVEPFDVADQRFYPLSR